MKQKCCLLLAAACLMLPAHIEHAYGQARPAAGSGTGAATSGSTSTSGSGSPTGSSSSGSGSSGIAGALPFGAPPRIPNELSFAGGTLNAQQLSTIDAYAVFWARQINSGSDDQVAEARNNLVEPISRQGISDPFRNAYSNAVVNQLLPAFVSDRIIVKMNIMIIAGQLADGRSLRLVSSGLVDPSPAVRYWAARGAANTAARPNLSRADRGVLMNSLIGQMVNEGQEKEVRVEGTQQVLKQILLAIGELNLPEANEELLRGVNQRITLHMKIPALTIDPEHEAIKRLYIKAVQARTTGGAKEVPDTLVRQLGTVSFRYLLMSAAMLDQKRLADSPFRIAESEQVIRTTDQVLRWVRETLGPQVPQPTPIDAELAARNHALIRLRVEEWRKALTTPPINLSAADLDVPLTGVAAGN